MITGPTERRLAKLEQAMAETLRHVAAIRRELSAIAALLKARADAADTPPAPVPAIAVSQPPRLSVKAAAAFLDMSAAVLYRLVDRHEIDYLETTPAREITVRHPRTGQPLRTRRHGKLLFEQMALEAWLERKRVRSGTPPAPGLPMPKHRRFS